MHLTYKEGRPRDRLQIYLPTSIVDSLSRENYIRISKYALRAEVKFPFVSRYRSVGRAQTRSCIFLHGKARDARDIESDTLRVCALSLVVSERRERGRALSRLENMKIYYSIIRARQKGIEFPRSFLLAHLFTAPICIFSSDYDDGYAIRQRVGNVSRDGK